MTEPGKPASTKKTHAELYFRLMEAENLLQTARNRTAEAATRFYEDAKTCPEILKLAEAASEVCLALVKLENKVQAKASALAVLGGAI